MKSVVDPVRPVATGLCGKPARHLSSGTGKRSATTGNIGTTQCRILRKINEADAAKLPQIGLRCHAAVIKTNRDDQQTARTAGLVYR